GKSALALSKLSRNQIIAIDNDPKALKIANKLKGQNFRNLRFILGDAQNLGELISDKASLIYSLQALHHFDDLDRVCDGLNSTIHPDGIVLIQDFDRGFSHLVYESRGFGISSGKIESFRKAREAGPEAFREYLSRKGDLAGKDFWINTALSVFAAYTPEEVMLKLKERNFKAGWRTPENKMSYCLVAARPEFWHRTSLHRYFPV
ncbi:MAG: methyltransferase domain-containing protein, partial [Nanoarchaeota archaeon]|nr:methyltransferase domain-containing protein [Nanoarchaeota archaeon]